MGKNPPAFQVSGASCGKGLCEAGDGENCATCPADCAGKQTGSEAKQYCCGFDDGQVTNPIGCDAGAEDNRCVDASNSLFCRVPERVRACWGDALCEGQETGTSCGVDCDTTCPREPEGPPQSAACSDCDALIDAGDPDCVDSDGDGLSDVYETNRATDPQHPDSDGDGLVDGDDGVVPLGTLGNGVDADGDSFVDGEQTLETDPLQADSDGDRLDDGLEVANASDPNDADSWPRLADADCEPLDNPDALVNAADLVVATRIAMQLQPATALELAHCDMGSMRLIWC